MITQDIAEKVIQVRIEINNIIRKINETRESKIIGREVRMFLIAENFLSLANMTLCELAEIEE